MDNLKDSRNGPPAVGSEMNRNPSQEHDIINFF
jgi:hypothetical protein